MATVVHLAALSAVGAGYPDGIPVFAPAAPPALGVPPTLVVPPATVVRPPLVAPPGLVVPPLRAVPVVPPEPPFPLAPPVDMLPPSAEVPPVPDVPPVPTGLQVPMHRAQMSDGTSRSVAQHAHAQTVSAHWPSTGIGTFSSEEQVQLPLPSLASHWAMAVYCTLHFVMALTVASASFTQLVWQLATRQALGCDAHIAVQACCRVSPVPEPPDPLPPTPTPPEPARVPPVAAPVAPPEAIPPVPTRVPPLPGMPPRDVAPAPGLPPSELLLLEQANAKSIAASRMRRTVPVLCMRKLPPVKGGLLGNSG
jgi:hypothetical protein